MEYYLAIDIGASSGRHMLFSLEDGKMTLEEVHRFPNGIKEVDGVKTWDVEALWNEILEGLRKCKAAGKIPKSVGIDTWAVDYVLLDEDNNRIGPAVAYRDSRTSGMDKKVYEVIPEKELYERTGIQKQIFNTIYQLMAVKENAPEDLTKAKSLLMIPDYFHFLLTGKKVCEYTNATTTQLVSPETKDWDEELLSKLGYPADILQPIVTPGTSLGQFKDEVAEAVGFQCEVIVPATHDTGSAVAAVPSESDDTLYISSGTWSLMGTELHDADCSLKSMAHNFTNEGGVDYRFRYLKNIMGLWMIQSVRKEIAADLGFGEICEMASKCDISSIVDCNDARFLAPENMTKEVQKACEESGQQVPEGVGEVAAVIYNSLATCYKNTLQEIEEMAGRTYDSIHIIGGGANADYLNRLTAKYAERAVYAGPTEATAIGNATVQMMKDGTFEDLKAARRCIRDSFEIKEYLN